MSQQQSSGDERTNERHSQTASDYDSDDRNERFRLRRRCDGSSRYASMEELLKEPRNLPLATGFRRQRCRDGRRPGAWKEEKFREPRNPPPATRYDDAYFRYCSDIVVHEEMIKDTIRTEAYRNAIFTHRDLIFGKVVVDVGCGTGLLSIFCAQAGARRVYAIEASSVAAQAYEVVKANNFEDIIEVFHGRVEDVEILEEVDVIVSEWMGYMLFYEGMLESVIVARERWLKPGGLILPSHATLYMVLVSNPVRYSESVDFWHGVYGIDMSAMMPLAKQCAFREPSVELVGAGNVLTCDHVVKRIDCSTVTIQELKSITSEFRLTPLIRAPLNGFAFWFDVEFCAQMTDGSEFVAIDINSQVSINHNKNKRDRSLILTTAPEHPPTHWQQTVIYMYDPIMVEHNEVIEGSLTLKQSKVNRRYMDIQIEFSSGDHRFVKEAVLR